MGGKRRLVVTTGQRFGKGVVTDAEISLKPSKGRTTPERGVRLVCDCGTAYECLISHLLRGTHRSCGCDFVSNASARATRHGLSKHELYPIWKACRNSPATHLIVADLGGRKLVRGEQLNCKTCAYFALGAARPGDHLHLYRLVPEAGEGDG